MIRATLLAAVVAAPAHALSVGDCASTQDMLVMLADNFGEYPMGVMPSDSGDAFTVTVNPDERNWTLVRVREGTRTACIEDFGKGFEMNYETMGSGV